MCLDLDVVYGLVMTVQTGEYRLSAGKPEQDMKVTGKKYQGCRPVFTGSVKMFVHISFIYRHAAGDRL